MNTISASVLLSIFKRKGDLSVYIRMFEQDETFTHPDITYLEKEKPLILYNHGDKWLLITNFRVLGNMDAHIALLFEEIQSVKLNIDVTNLSKIKAGYTLILLTDTTGQQYTITFEPGKDGWGIYQVLDYTVGRKAAV